MSIDKAKFKKKFPSTEVARHEIFLSFVSDRDATDFHRWWHEEGKEIFKDWRTNRK